MKNEDVVASYHLEGAEESLRKRGHGRARSAIYYCTICTSFETPSWSGMQEHLKIKHNELSKQVSYRVRWEDV
jgi:hypothetical protein